MTTAPKPSPDAVELKPCPFCGKTEYLSTRRSSEYNDRQWTVRCCHVSHGHGCGSDCGFGSTTPAEAISKWNTRVNPAPGVTSVTPDEVENAWQCTCCRSQFKDDEKLWEYKTNTRNVPCCPVCKAADQYVYPLDTVASLVARLEHYPFTSEGGDLRMCAEWVAIKAALSELATYRKNDKGGVYSTRTYKETD